MTLKRLLRKHLGKQVGGIRLARDVAHDHFACAPHLAHLEELAVDVPRVPRRGVAVAEVVRRLVVCAYLDCALVGVANRLEHAADVDQLDRAVGERDKLGLTR
eukprot:7231717-Prymnesium_polylepis.1